MIIRGRRLFEEGDYFKCFRQRGAIIPGRRLIEGQLLFPWGGGALGEFLGGGVPLGPWNP